MHHTFCSNDELGRQLMIYRDIHLIASDWVNGGGGGGCGGREEYLIRQVGGFGCQCRHGHAE